MNTKVRMYVVSAAVIAALAGCGSEAQGGAAGHPTPTHPACPEGSAYPPGTAGAVDYTDSIWHDSVSYEYLPSVHVTAAQIGSVLTRIQCSMATYPDTHAPPSYLANDTATALSAGTPVHAVKGFSPRCRLAAYVAGKPRTYVAVNNTKHGPVFRACAKVASVAALCWLGEAPRGGHPDGHLGCHVAADHCLRPGDPRGRGAGKSVRDVAGALGRCHGHQGDGGQPR